VATSLPLSTVEVDDEAVADVMSPQWEGYIHEVVKTSLQREAHNIKITIILEIKGFYFPRSGEMTFWYNLLKSFTLATPTGRLMSCSPLEG
jgi:hypothetical protein